MFTPELAKWYTKLRDGGKKIEIIFASADHSEEDFKHYFETMPWLSIGFDSTREKALSAKFEVEGIPTLVFLSPDGKVITDDGRGYVDADPEGKDFPYGPKPFSELTPAVINTLNHSRCIVAFVDHLDPTNADAVVSAIRPRVEAYVKDHPIVDGSLRFLWAGEHDLVGRVREFMGVTEEDSPFLLFMHVSKRMKAVRSLVEDPAATFDLMLSEADKGTLATVSI